MPRKKLYLKDKSYDPFYSQKNTSFFMRSLRPQIFMFLGIFILVTQVVIPLTFYDSIENTLLGLASGFGKFEFKELQEKQVALDQNNLAAGQIDEQSQDVLGEKSANIPEKFYITIPKLGIENAQIETNSIDLSPDDRLGHYAGTALPGEIGNILLYGHSALPVFYDPKNYKTIFSTLNKLEEGDKFTLRYNNRTYTYEVTGKEIAMPANINPLEAQGPEYLNQNTITLLTCWPAGTKISRLMVNAILVN